MLAKRIIPCLDVRDGRVVKGVQFRDHRDLGAIVPLAERYREEGADELVFYDITASPEGRSADRDWVEKVAATLDIPFCVAGGIRDLETAESLLHAGADKISINTPAIRDPDLINRLADRFGSQCVVVGIDSIRVDDARGNGPRDNGPRDNGQWQVRQMTGDPDKMRSGGWQTLDWIREVQDRGAGEIVLNCMSADGTRAGYDIEQLSAARAICHVPLVASGGAGNEEHFREAFNDANVDAALAASVFHEATLSIGALKEYLVANAITVRQ